MPPLPTVFDAATVAVGVFVRILLGLTVVVADGVLLLMVERDILLEPEAVLEDMRELVVVKVVIGDFVRRVLREKDGEELDVLEDDADLVLLLEPEDVLEANIVIDCEGEALVVLLFELDAVIVLDTSEVLVLTKLGGPLNVNLLDMERIDVAEGDLDADAVRVDVCVAVFVFVDVEDAVIGLDGNAEFERLVVFEEVLLSVLDEDSSTLLTYNLRSATSFLQIEF